MDAALLKWLSGALQWPAARSKMPAGRLQGDPLSECTGCLVDALLDAFKRPMPLGEDVMVVAIASFGATEGATEAERARLARFAEQVHNSIVEDYTSSTRSRSEKAVVSPSTPPRKDASPAPGRRSAKAAAKPKSSAPPASDAAGNPKGLTPPMQHLDCGAPGPPADLLPAPAGLEPFPYTVNFADLPLVEVVRVPGWPVPAAQVLLSPVPSCRAPPTPTQPRREPRMPIPPSGHEGQPLPSPPLPRASPPAASPQARAASPGSCALPRRAAGVPALVRCADLAGDALAPSSFDAQGAPLLLSPRDCAPAPPGGGLAQWLLERQPCDLLPAAVARASECSTVPSTPVFSDTRRPSHWPADPRSVCHFEVSFDCA
ncbi:unnamed protein product [Prorocentrum cordatum]|uniref:Uncharacterized protein n=1 Tax=Prorocentrum cordatum TaxID=2364126 RepID=A0ABN9Q6L0_9DINO|nr:unnamed protein product [Polarella glacialis]